MNEYTYLEWASQQELEREREALEPFWEEVKGSQRELEYFALERVIAQNHIRRLRLISCLRVDTARRDGRLPKQEKTMNYDDF